MGEGGGGTMRPYRNKTTPCTGFFFCTPLGYVNRTHGQQRSLVNCILVQQLINPLLKDNHKAEPPHYLLQIYTSSELGNERYSAGF